MKRPYPTPDSGRRQRRRSVQGAPPRQPNFRRATATMAAGALGYIVGDVPGAYYAGRLAYNMTTPAEQVPQTKKNMPKTKPVNQMVNKSKKKVTGKVTLNKDHKVKVSEYLKAAIKQTMASTTAVGTYTQRSMGYFGYGLGNPADITIAGTALGGTDIGAIFPGYQGSNGQRCLFNQLYTYNPGAATTAIPGTELNFFTPGKIWHAASVLFNQKTNAVNPYAVSNNLGTSYVAASGIVNTATTNTLKLNVMSSMVQMSLKNTSNRVVTLEIWELEPTLKFQLDNPLQSLKALSDTVNDDGTIVKQWYVLNGVLGQQNSILDSFFDPVAQMQKCGFKFRGKKRSMVLAPDETCVHSIKGPSGILDWKDMVVDGGLQQFHMQKNWSVGCIVSVVPDMVCKVGLADTGSKSVLFPAIGNSGYLNLPIAVEMTEYYKIAVPEIAGFVTNHAAALTRQTLNQRRTRNVIFNLQGGHGLVAAGDYEVSNEENPLEPATADSRT